ncbi:Alpha/beta hydrolase family protein [Actinomadura rubteroloni]|uniref:poly(ethylene terephthalate) hydrolase n=1 Tax=Actinomadura rubteroloni TaxID=1926885 RepID=A0A2P4UPT6_9ACTN|nr:acetylxylan esterase [Actinomadura rubteroloni]POM27066.1 Alpha/beta hydrolase family protein [Actinomadura rubteroloni]
MQSIAGRRLLPLLTALAAALALLVPSTAPARAAAPGGSWDKPGPYRVTSKTQGDTTLYYPADIAASADKHPVIVWGNGTFAWPQVYDGLLRHWASQGFVVAAANTAFSNTGLEMRAGIDLLAKENAKAGSPFQNRIDLANIGAAGHSQGGAGAINATLDPRIKTTVPIQPGPLALSSYLHGPTLYLAGQNDTIVPPALVQAFYDNSAQVPAVYAELAGATHFTTVGDAGGFRGITTAWFRFQLMGDEQARSLFFGKDCGICSGSTWLNVKRDAKALQIPGHA